MKKYLAPEVELLTLCSDVLMASAEINGSPNETAKDYIADLVINEVDNI
ncbi:MAG: hypothetical protein IJY20_01770 [Clostridia bacterium]|nr:hypothetical protein [Clostridia bacterium]